MQINQLTYQHAISWFKSGWILFSKQPLQWIAMFFLVLLIGFILNMIPFGGLVFMVLSPALFGGIYAAMEAVENGQKVTLGQVFQVLQDSQRRNAFFFLGGLNFLFNTVFAVLLLSFIGGSEGLTALMNGGAAADEVVQKSGIWIMMVLLPLLIVYLMAFIYAVPLILFKNLSVKNSLIWSLRAGFTNFIPMLVAAIIYLVLAFLSSLIFGLGFVILIPVSFMVVYYSFKELFNMPGSQSGKSASTTVIEF